MFRHYLTVALRSVRRSPFTASVSVLALALGLTAFVTAYGVVNYWDRSERQFSNADRTYVITMSMQVRNGPRAGTSPTTNRLYAEYLKADFPEFEAVARAQVMNDKTGVANGDVRAEVFAVGVDAEFLDIFDLPFVAGDAENALREPNSIVLTQAAATQLFGDTDPIGRTVLLANVLDVTVTGVIGPIPEPSHLGRSATASLRFDMLGSWDTIDGTQAAARERAAPQNPPPPNQPPPPPANQPPPPENWLGGYCCTTYVMLARDSDLTDEALNARLAAFGESHVPAGQAEIAKLTIGAEPISRLMVSQLNSQIMGGAPVSITTLLLLLGGLVLVVACVNYANLATAQAARRAREVGLRKSIGASVSRVMTQYLSEAAVLTAAAAVLALIAIRLITPVLRNSVGVDLGVGLFDDARLWAFLAAVLVAVTLLGGAYPAFVLSRVTPLDALRIGRTKVGPRFAGTLLVGIQFAAASFLLIVVIVMYTQNDTLRRTGLGSMSDPLIVIENRSMFTGVDPDLLQSEFARLPQVTGFTETNQSPWGPAISITGLGRTPSENVVTAQTFMNFVGYDFFSTLDFTILGGREFDREHGDAPFRGFNSGQTSSAVIDAALARQLNFEPPQAAVDQTIYFPEENTRAFGVTAMALRVVGVVGDRPLHFRGAGATSNVYLLQPRGPFQIVRVAANDVPGGLAAIDAVWGRLSTQTPISRQFMDELFDQNYRNFARLNQVFAGLALVAVLISVVGLFGMALQVASRRVHEIGVRKSVGARTSQIVTLLLRQFGNPVLAANVIAWPLAYFAAQQYLSVFMQRIPLTPTPFVLSLAATVLIACLAVGGQALRAARVSPAQVLRME